MDGFQISEGLPAQGGQAIDAHELLFVVRPLQQRSHVATCVAHGRPPAHQEQPREASGVAGASVGVLGLKHATWVEGATARKGGDGLAFTGLKGEEMREMRDER